MSLVSAVRPVILLLLIGVVSGGCLPDGRSPLDEQKDPYFLKGKGRVNSMDYQGAIEAFEKALEANPRSASAHKELGMLYLNERVKDHAAAIYHFERLLRLRPDDPHADMARQWIVDCKQQLARAVSLAPVTQQMQRELEQLEKLKKENAELRQQVEVLKAQILHRTPVAPTPVGPLPAPGPARTNTAATNPPPRVVEQTVSAGPTAGAKPAAPALRTHTVKSGETPSSIARQYGLALNVLLEANPKVNPRKMQIGQTLKIPAP